MTAKNKLNLSAFILGLTSIISQIIIIRELIVIFYGNELSLGVILATWLFWVSVGSAILGRFIDRLKAKEKLLSSVQLLTSIVLPLTIFLIRNIKSILNIPAGKIIAFMPMLGASFISLSIIGIILGFTFTLISRLAAEKTKNASTAIGKVYLMEGLGASIGGLAYSFFLIKALSPFQNVFLAGGVNLLASFLFNANILQLLYLIGLSLTFIFNWPLELDSFTRKLQFRPFEVIESADSIYGNITVTKAGREFSFYENGLLLFTSNDLLTSEESVHYAMLEHPSPQKILLIGGGVSGSLKEILKHPVKSVDYVELDPLIIQLAEKYLPPIKDRRVNVIHEDGRLFVKQKFTSHEPLATSHGYDVVILNLPDPYTAMLNRFYSVEFFREAKNILAPGGILSFALTSSENYINPEQAYYLASIHNTLKEEFQDIKILPGDSATFLASNKTGVLTYDSNILIERLRQRKIDTKFVREYYLPFKLSLLRVKYIEDALRESSLAKINQDFKPIGYFYNMSLWMTLFYGGKNILPYIEKMDLSLFIYMAIALFALFFLIQKLKKASFKMPVILSVGTTGMSEISFQIIVILAFQFLYGYVYYRIGLILTSFMIGLVLGSFFINRRLESIKNEEALYLKTQVFICLYPLILPLVFASPFSAVSFAFLPIIAGFLGGFQFPLANKICLKSSAGIGKTTGALYGIDLFGSCVGGLLAVLLFIPLLGITQTCILLFIINALVLILLKLTNLHCKKCQLSPN